MDEKTYNRGKNPRLKATKAGGKRDLGIAPAKFFLQWFKKGGKAKEDNAAHIETDNETGKYEPPSIKNLAIVHRFTVHCSLFTVDGS
jgi:hypothetical protein